MPCTGAGLSPIPKDSDPTWNQKIFNLFAQFEDPLVYTPGDNEWTDCHETKEFSSGAPLNELAAVRSLFFARDIRCRKCEIEPSLIGRRSGCQGFCALACDQTARG